MFEAFKEPPEVLEVERYLNKFPIVVKESVEEINSTYIGRAILGEEHAAEDVALGHCHSGTFLCPIFYDDEPDPIILVADNQFPILRGFSKDDTRELIDCPLNALMHSRCLQAFIDAIDHPISLSAYRESIRHGRRFTRSPLTRRPILGALTLGAHQSHVEATNWTLM